jgi:hypothetical protein
MGDRVEKYFFFLFVVAKLQGWKPGSVSSHLSFCMAVAFLKKEAHCN